jgi:hypothetical protein
MPKCKVCNGKFNAQFFNQKTCSKSCNSEYLAENKPTSVKRVSDKRQRQLDEYAVIREEYLNENKHCVPCNDHNIKTVATEIHHKNGREGERLNDKRFFLSSCEDCHRHIHLNPKESREKGYLI